MRAQDADLRRRILERRAAFLTASLAALGGCSAPPALTPLPSIDSNAPGEADGSAPSATARSTADASTGSLSDASWFDVVEELDAPRVVLRVCLSIIIPPAIGFGPYGTQIVSGRDAVDEVARVMRNQTDFTVEVQGHADSMEVDSNGRLSRRRAELVVKALVDQGVASERLCVKAVGSSHPVVPNDTPAHRARNRRVEFRKMDLGESCDTTGASTPTP